jgi:hypothetical protein
MSDADASPAPEAEKEQEQEETAVPTEETVANEEAGDGEKLKVTGDTTVTPVQYQEWHKRNEKFYQVRGPGGLWGVSPQFYPPTDAGGVGGETPQEAELLSIKDLISHLAVEKRRFATDELTRIQDNPEFMVERFTSALVHGDVLVRKLAERYEPSKDTDDETKKSFLDAHAAWAGVIVTQYVMFFTSLGRRVKQLPQDAPLKTLYERLVQANFVPVF